MDERERADKLAEAIEEMVQGRVPEGLDDEELEELLKIAKIRLDAARMAADATEGARDEVYERLIARLNLRHPGEEVDSVETQEELPGIENFARGFAPGDDDPSQQSVRELQDVIGLRRHAAECAVAVAEGYSNAVWQRVEARVQAQQSEKRGFVHRLLRRRDPRAEEFGAAVDRMILGEPMWEAEDSKLVHVARLRRAVAVTAGSGFYNQQERVWARVRPRLVVNLRARRAPKVFERRRSRAPRPRLAAAGALAALVIAALGPIPATGFAQHPAAEAIRFVVGHVAVSETSSPPPEAPVSEVLKPMDVTLEQARGLLGLPAAEPTFVPSGYEKVSSRFFTEGITASAGGLFVQAYETTGAEGETETVLVYQEHAGGTSLAVQEGFAQNLQLQPGLFATHIQGTWKAADGGSTWGAETGQTVMFDQNGMRTVIIASDDELSSTELRVMAEGLADQGAAD